MRYENIKSTILVFLILLSAILTWNLWTYQPNHETLGNPNYVEEVAIDEKKEIKKLVRPNQIFYHVKEDHFGTMNSNDIDKVMRELSTWSIYDIENETDRIQNFKETVHGKGNVEIVFPADVPIEIYKAVLNFEEKKLPAFEFDRIVINIDNNENTDGVVHFVSYKNQVVYKGHISSTALSNFYRDFYRNADQLPRYSSLDIGKRTLFLPAKETVMDKYKFLPQNLDSDEFKEALFNDPSFVKKSLVKNGEEFTDGSSKMNVNDDSNMLLYVNPGEENEYIAKPNELLMRSIDFINEHGGFTDAYRYVSLDEINQKVTFRLYSIEGYPVFNESGMSEITQVWGRSEINKYVRPNFSLDLPLKMEMEKMTLPSGQEAFEFLKKREGFKLELLEEITPGYQMSRDSKQQKLIVLEPTWFYRYDKSWGQLTMEELGGLKRGLE